MAAGTHCLDSSMMCCMCLALKGTGALHSFQGSELHSSGHPSPGVRCTPQIASQGGSPKKQKPGTQLAMAVLNQMPLEYRPIDIQFLGAVDCWPQLPSARMEVRGRGHLQARSTKDFNPQPCPHHVRTYLCSMLNNLISHFLVLQRGELAEGTT